MKAKARTACGLRRWLALATGVVMVFVGSTAVAAASMSDVDGDGVADVVDNCVDHANADQRDSNGDGFGNRCDPDLDNNEITNSLDLGAFKAVFFTTPDAANWNPDADFNGDDVVNAVDLATMKEFFFRPPGPVAITFVNPDGGTFTDAANWSPAVLPRAVHTVRIDLAPGKVVEHAGITTIAGLLASSDLRIAGGELSVQGEMQVNATLTIADGALADATVLSSTTSEPVLVAPDSEPILRNLTLAADLIVQDGAEVYCDPGLTLAGGSVTIATDGSDTRVYLGLGGAGSRVNRVLGHGEIIFGGSVGPDFYYLNWFLPRIGGGVEPFVIGPDVTVRTTTGGGLVGRDDRETLVQGALISDVEDRLLRIGGSPLVFDKPPTLGNGGHFSVTLEGRLNVPLTMTDGGNLTVQGDWRNPAGNVISISGGGELKLVGFTGLAQEFVNEPGAQIIAQDSLVTLGKQFRNLGQIAISGGRLTLGTLRIPWLNSGMIDVDNAVVELGGRFDLGDLGVLNTLGEVVLIGELENSGQVLNLDADLPGEVSLGSGQVTGGTLVGPVLEVLGPDTFTLEAVTLATDFSVGDGGMLRVDDRLTLDGATILLNSSGGLTVLDFASGARTLEGSGEVHFAGDTATDLIANAVWTNSGQALTIGPGITVRTATAGGRIGLSFAPLFMNGSIVSDLAGRTVNLWGSEVTLSGDVRIGAGATVTARNDVSFGAGATVSVDIRGTDTADFGRVLGPSATLGLGGTFGASLIDGFVPGPGSAFDVMAWSASSGEFASFDLPAVPGGTFEASYLPNALRLTVDAPGPALLRDSFAPQPSGR